MDKVYKRDTHLKAGRLYQAKGNYNLALKEFKHFVELDPKNETAWLELGKTYKMMNNPQEAIKKFIQVRNIIIPLSLQKQSIVYHVNFVQNNLSSI